MDLSRIELLQDLSVLYVEDDETILDVVGDILKPLVRELHTAKDGSSGYKLFCTQNDIDVVITDIKMPTLDGLEMATKIKEIRNIPIIITTAYLESDYLMSAIRIGVSKYIPKPIDANELINAIADVVEPIKLRKELEIKNKKLDDLTKYLESRVQEEIQKNKEKDLLMLKQSKLVSAEELSDAHLHELNFYGKDLSIIVCENKFLFDRKVSNLIKRYFFHTESTNNTLEFMQQYEKAEYDIVILSIDSSEIEQTIHMIKHHKATQKIITLVYFEDYNYNELDEMCLIDKNDTNKLYYTLLLEVENISFEKRKSKYTKKLADNVQSTTAHKIIPITESVNIINDIDYEKNETTTKIPEALSDIKLSVIKIDANDFDFDDIMNIKADLESICGEFMLNRLRPKYLDDVYLIFTRFYNTFYTFLAIDLKYQLQPFAQSVKEIGDFVHGLEFDTLSQEQKTALLMVEHIIEDIIHFINFVFINREITDIHYLEASLRDNLKTLKIELGFEKKASQENMLLFF